MTGARFENLQTPHSSNRNCSGTPCPIIQGLTRMHKFVPDSFAGLYTHSFPEFTGYVDALCVCAFVASNRWAKQHPDTFVQ